MVGDLFVYCCDLVLLLVVICWFRVIVCLFSADVLFSDFDCVFRVWVGFLWFGCLVLWISYAGLDLFALLPLLLLSLVVWFCCLCWCLLFVACGFCIGCLLVGLWLIL